MSSSTSRRAFLAGATAVVGGSLAACRPLAGPVGHLPGAPPMSPPPRLLGLYPVDNLAPSATAHGPDPQVAALLQQSVDAVADGARADIDRQISWTGVPPTVGATSGEETVLQQALASSAPTPPALVLFSSVLPRPGANGVRLTVSAVLERTARAGLLRPLADVLSTPGRLERSDYPAGVLAAGQVQGKQYGLPIDITPGMLEYDRTLFRAARITPPDSSWDWQQFLTAAQALSAPPHRYAFAVPGVPPLQLFLWQNGADVLSPDGRRCTLDDLPAIEAATFYHDLFTRYQVVAPPTATPRFQNGQLSAGGAPLAMQFATSLVTFGEAEPQRVLRFAEPFHGKQRATSLSLERVLALTSRATDPAKDGAALVALADELQRRSYLPAQQSLARVADPGKEGLALSADETAAVVQAAGYARANTLSNEVNSAYITQLERPLQEAGTSPEAACHATSLAITALLAPS